MESCLLIGYSEIRVLFSFEGLLKEIPCILRFLQVKIQLWSYLFFLEYVQRLVCDWSPVEFFIEGKRSRTGMTQEFNKAI